jgi:hypothetical protein
VDKAGLRLGRWHNPKLQIKNHLDRGLFVKTLISVLTVSWLLGVLVWEFLANFMTYASPTGMRDGLGRQLEETPSYIRDIIWGVDSLWPGWGWFAFDFILFWGTIPTAIFILSRNGNPRI